MATSQFSEPNKVYVVTSAITGDVNVGAGSTLVFQGGKISNGKITGNNVTLRFDSITHTFSNVTFNGKFNCDCFYPELFGARGDSKTDDASAIQRCADAAFAAGVFVVKFLPNMVPYTEVSDPLIIAKSARTYNSLSHLTSLTTDHYAITINPCDAAIQSPGEIDELFTFPNISFEYYSSLYDPATQTSYACHVYKGTPYYHHTLNFTPVCEQLTTNTTTYLTPHQEESEE